MTVLLGLYFTYNIERCHTYSDEKRMIINCIASKYNYFILFVIDDNCLRYNAIHSKYPCVMHKLNYHDIPIRTPAFHMLYSVRK